METVMYLTWGSTPRSYGVYQSQVVRQLKATSSVCPDWTFHLLAAVPIVHSGFVKEGIRRHAEQIENIRESLGKITFHQIPIFAPQHFVNSTKFTFGFMHGWSHRLLANKIGNISPTLVHCRSYHAAWAAMSVRDQYGFSYKIIFDARGMWPEEMSLKKGLPVDSASYNFLKHIERRLIDGTDAVVSVSDPMSQHYSTLGAKSVKTIYLSAPVDDFAVNTSINQVKPDDNTTLCYLGALSKNTWHKPEQLTKLYMKFRQIVPSPKLLIITTSPSSEYTSELKDIPSDEIRVEAAYNVEQLRNLLQQGNIGVLSYFIPKTGLEKLLASSVFAIKTCEYISAGLPVLVNRYCTGAAQFIEDKKLGIAYDPHTLVEINRKSISKVRQEISIENVQAIAKDMFSYTSNAQRFAALYREFI